MYRVESQRTGLRQQETPGLQGQRTTPVQAVKGRLDAGLRPLLSTIIENWASSGRNRTTFQRRRQLLRGSPYTDATTQFMNRGNHGDC